MGHTGGLPGPRRTLQSLGADIVSSLLHTAEHLPLPKQVVLFQMGHEADDSLERFATRASTRNCFQSKSMVSETASRKDPV